MTAQVERFLSALLKAPNGFIVVVGRSRKAIEHEFLQPLHDLGRNVLQARKGAHEVIVGGRKVLLLNGSDYRAEHRIRGMNIALAFVDDSGLKPPIRRELWTLLPVRLRPEGASGLCWSGARL